MLQENAANEIRNESDDVSQCLKFAIKIIFFDATMGSKNYTICKIHMSNIFPTDWGNQSAFTPCYSELYFLMNSLEHR